MTLGRGKTLFCLWERWALGFASLSIGLLVLLVSLQAELTRAWDEFQVQAEGKTQAIAQRLSSADGVLTSLTGLYQASASLSETELTFAAQQLLETYPHIDSIIYLSWVQAEDREDFVNRMRLAGLPQFRIHDIGSPGRREFDVTASVNHLAVSFVEPLSPRSARLLGADFLSDPLSAKSLSKAVSTGQIEAAPTSAFAGPDEYLLVKATYFGHEPPHTIEERLQQLSGLFALVIDLPALGRNLNADGKALRVDMQGLGPLEPPAESSHHTHLGASSAYHLLTDLIRGVSFEFEHRSEVHIGNETIGVGITDYWYEVLGSLWISALLGIAAACITVAMGMLFGSRRLAQRERKESQVALYQERERATVTLRSIGDGVISTDNNFRIHFLNPAAESLTGWPAKRALGRRLDEVLTIIDEVDGVPLQYPTQTYFRRLLSENSRFRLLRPDGANLAIDHTATRLTDHNREIIGAVLVIRDVSRERQLTNELAYRANHDTLTGLPNRKFFQQHLQHSLDRAKETGEQVAVLFFDLDQFKLINDTLGHSAGDELLKQVSQTIRACLRDGDLLARLGGDEFAAVLEGLPSRRVAETAAERALKGLCGSFDLSGTEVFLTTSIGMSLYPKDGTDLPTLLKNADAACYHAKAQGRNNWQVFTRHMSKAAEQRIRLEKHLRKAVDNGEISVRYQPQLDMVGGRIVGLEALARWHNPELGDIPPNQFIRIAEETGLIAQIGEYILHESCSQNRRWRDQGLAPLQVSVNLSARQFKDDKLASRIKKILRDSGLAPDGLTLEITESAIMDDMELTLGTLDRLSAMGIGLSIDDFGTGYSSLAALKQFPLDALKIDRSFIRDLTTDPDDREIVEAIIAMAHNMRLKVVAEGVETPEQFELLSQRKCDQIQGYYVSKPLSPENATALLTSDFAAAPASGAPLQPKRGEILRQFHKR